MSKFLVEVSYAGQKNGRDHWIASLEGLDGKDVRWGEEMYYGGGETVDAALAETGRKLQELLERRRAEYQAKMGVGEINK